MIIVKSPLRISFFGGSTDYKSFYSEYGSFIIGTTIDKYVYLSMRKRPNILSKESIITYSKFEAVDAFSKIQNPLIRETLIYSKMNCNIEFNSFSDIPFRTGLGGSSSYCIGLLTLIKKIKDEEINKKEIIKDSIQIERIILNEPGGIQDQIWPSYGGLNTIEINTQGDFFVKPLPVTEDFKKELENSMVLIYTNEQRSQNEIASSHESKNKHRILEISRNAYQYFLNEDIKGIGNLLFESWKEKSQISNLISTNKINTIAESVMRMGAYGVKLLGAGGCGFILVMCDPNVKKTITNVFGDNILNIKFENDGVSQIYP